MEHVIVGLVLLLAIAMAVTEKTKYKKR